MYEVIVLFNGYSEVNGLGTIANGTSTLLKGQDNIIVDTLTPWDGEKLVAQLTKNNVNCEDIKYVICTHGHSDHTGCNYLFPMAKLIVGYCISYKTHYFDHDFKSGNSYIINDYVEVLPTPGHTMEDVSVLVETKDKGLVAVTGDLFERKEDLFDDSIWKSAGSVNPNSQLTNRNLILQRADWIVPGHGPMFQILDKYRNMKFM